MNELKPTSAGRRQFLIKAVPACALTCFGGSKLLGQGAIPGPQQAVHKFDNPFERPLTYRQFQRIVDAGKIQLIKTMIKEMGRDKAVEILKTDTRENALLMGQNQAKALKKNDFSTYVGMFRDPNRYKFTLTKEIVEDSEKAFELKVTECLFAESYIKAGLGGDVGFAAVCYMDYFWPKGFNEKIELVRDKTLMQGQDCCNHRYIWKG